jgi:hypothetical protein
VRHGDSDRYPACRRGIHLLRDRRPMGVASVPEGIAGPHSVWPYSTGSHSAGSHSAGPHTGRWGTQAPVKPGEQSHRLFAGALRSQPGGGRDRQQDGRAVEPVHWVRRRPARGVVDVTVRCGLPATTPGPFNLYGCPHIHAAPAGRALHAGPEADTAWVRRERRPCHRREALQARCGIRSPPSAGVTTSTVSGIRKYL